MSIFKKKKRIIEEPVKKITKHKETNIILHYAYGGNTDKPFIMTAQKRLEEITETRDEIVNNLGEDYILGTNNGAINLKFFCAVTFKEIEVPDIND